MKNSKTCNGKTPKIVIFSVQNTKIYNLVTNSCTYVRRCIF